MKKFALACLWICFSLGVLALNLSLTSCVAPLLLAGGAYAGGTALGDKMNEDIMKGDDAVIRMLNKLREGHSNDLISVRDINLAPGSGKKIYEITRTNVNPYSLPGAPGYKWIAEEKGNNYKILANLGQVSKISISKTASGGYKDIKSYTSSKKTFEWSYNADKGVYKLQLTKK